MKVKIKVTKKPSVDTESQEQIRFVSWCRNHPIAKRIYHIPNGGQRSITTAVRLKAEGTVAGVPDLALNYPHGNYHGLFIEMKRIKGGKVSPEQQDWLEYLNSVGYKAVVCKGFDEAVNAIEVYLK